LFAHAPADLETVDDALLAGVRGKFYGATMLVGLRVHLVSQWRTPDGQLRAVGSVHIGIDGNGNPVLTLGSHTGIDPAGAAGSVAPGASATGGDGLQVSGFTQVVQLAGDGNNFANVAAITFAPSSFATPDGLAPGGSSTAAGGLTASVSFDGGINVGLQAPGGFVGQRLGSGANGGQMLQVARVAGNDQIGSNALQMQLLTASMPASMQQQLGVMQALAGLHQLPR
jgi:hypothetical protein